MTPEVGATISTMPMRLVGIVTQKPKMLRRGRQCRLGVILGILRDLEILLRDGAVLKQVHGAIQLLAREEFVGNGLAVSVEASGYVVAANGQQQLALFHRVAQASMNRHNPA